MLARVRVVGGVFTFFVLLSLLYMFSFHSIFSALEISQEKILAKLLKRNLSSWTQREIEYFMKLKEFQYEERRTQVKKFCVEYQEQFSNGTSRMNLMYNKKDRISYCAIPKVASSTWCWHFIQLGKTQIAKTSKF